MALLFLDSFDHYATGDLTEKWTTDSGTTIVAGAGRRSTACRRGGSSTRSLAVGSTTAVIGLALKSPGLVNAPFITVMSSTTSQMAVSTNTVGQLVVWHGPFGDTVLGTTTAVIAAGTYYCIELKVVIHPSAGSVVLRINEAEVLNLSGVNTAKTGTAAWDGIKLDNAGDIDDLYVLDGAGSAPLNHFLGDCRVDACYPTAEGASSAWTPLSGTDNAAMVDETAPDDDTTYNATATVGATDTHVVQDAPAPGAVLYGVQLSLAAKKTDTGTCSIAPVVRHAGVDQVGTAFNPSTSYAYYVAPYGLNPGTGAAWTEADFNAAEFGYQRTA